MLISVIVPVYQVETTLEKCVASLTALPPDCQGRVEIILVDDGSTDGSRELCDEIASKNDCVKVIHQENGGVAQARNTGMKNACGKYLMFMDADDQFIADEWHTVISCAEKEIDFAAFSYDSMFMDGKLVEEPFPEEVDGSADDERFMNVLLGTPLLHTCWGKLFKSDIVKLHGLSFPSGVAVGEDYIFVMEYCKYIETQTLKNVPVLKYFQNPSGAMRSFNLQKRMDCLDILWRYCTEYVNDPQRCKYCDTMCLYQFFSMLTIIRSLVSSVKGMEKFRLTKRLLHTPVVMDIVAHAPTKMLGGYRRLEYILVKHQWTLLTVCYFSIKQALMK